MNNGRRLGYQRTFIHIPLVEDTCIRRLLETRVKGYKLYPLLFYLSLSVSLVVVLILQVQDALHVHRRLNRRRHSPYAGSVSPETGPDVLRAVSQSSEASDSIDPKQGREIPEWVLQPAASDEGAPDPMEGVKTCLLAGKTLPECTQQYRTEEPASGVQGLQALLIKGVDLQQDTAQLVERNHKHAPRDSHHERKGPVRTTDGKEAWGWRANTSSAAILRSRQGEMDGYAMWRDGLSTDGADRYMASTIFQGKRGGFFVDIGSNDGIPPSNTLLFENCFGWTGLCIDPVSESQLRHRCTAVRIAVSTTQGFAVMWQVSPPGEGLSVLENAVSNTHIDAIARVADVFGAQKLEVKVQVATLPEVLRLYAGGREIDILSISVGSGFLDALKGCSIASVRPAIVIADVSLCEKQDVIAAENLLTREGYAKRKEIAQVLLYQRI